MLLLNVNSLPSKPKSLVSTYLITGFLHLCSPAPTRTPPAGSGPRPADGRTPSPQTERKDLQGDKTDLETISPVTSASPDKAPTIQRPR